MLFKGLLFQSPVKHKLGSQPCAAWHVSGSACRVRVPVPGAGRSVRLPSDIVWQCPGHAAAAQRAWGSVGPASACRSSLGCQQAHEVGNVTPVL